MQIAVARTFFEYFIKVNRLASANTLPAGTTTCNGYTVPTNDVSPNSGIINSDLHLYVLWENKTPPSSYAVVASYCVLNSGPRFGTINFNTAHTYYSSITTINSFEFDRLVEIVIHEMTHVLGFSYSAIPQWFQPGTTIPYGASVSTILSTATVRSISGSPILSSPEVLAYAKAYYGCTTLTGMYLENQGGAGNVGSHWE